MKAIKRFFKWSKKQVMFYIAIMAALVWFAFWILSRFAGTETYPVGYFQKIPFGVLGSCIILGAAFLWIKKTRPQSWDKLDDETEGGVQSITEWEKVKVSLFWVAIFAVLSGLLAFSL